MPPEEPDEPDEPPLAAEARRPEPDEPERARRSTSRSPSNPSSPTQAGDSTPDPRTVVDVDGALVVVGRGLVGVDGGAAGEAAGAAERRPGDLGDALLEHGRGLAPAEGWCPMDRSLRMVANWSTIGLKKPEAGLPHCASVWSLAGA